MNYFICLCCFVRGIRANFEYVLATDAWHCEACDCWMPADLAQLVFGAVAG